MELTRQVLTFGALGIAVVVLLVEMRNKPVEAYLLSGVGLMCIIAAFVADYLGDNYEYLMPQSVVFVFFAAHLVFRRQNDPFATRRS